MQNSHIVSFTVIKPSDISNVLWGQPVAVTAQLDIEQYNMLKA